MLVDTPGIHRPRTLLGQRLNDVVDESLADVDVVAFLLPADQEIGPGDKRILSRLRTDFATKREDGTFKWRIPLIAIVTKIDELGRQQLINKLIEINDFADFSDIVPVSALKHDNLAEVKNVLIEHTPEVRRCTRTIRSARSVRKTPSPNSCAVRSLRPWTTSCRIRWPWC